MLLKSLNHYESNKNKAVCFFSASSTGDFQQLYDFGIREILVSYFYIRKNLSYWEKMLPQFKSEGGIFMTDSGAFSFMGKYAPDTPEYDEMCKEESWLDYLNEYKNWLAAHKDYVFCAANLDIDTIVGEDCVNKWNKEIFEPLGKETGIQIVYVAHETDKSSLLVRLEEYCKKYGYVGANRSAKNLAPKVYQLVKHYKRRIHGFAWTELPLLRRYPFFSVDSTSWLSGVRYGTTFDYDGKNFRTYDAQHKTGVRKLRRVKYKKEGIDVGGIDSEKRVPINKMNLMGWLGFRNEYLKIANTMLQTKMVSYYER